MKNNLIKAVKEANHTRYKAGQRGGHYESYFLRANHPTKPMAFWIRYTIFSPNGSPEDAIGEIWAVYFDGETGKHSAVKKEIPISDCSFRNDSLDVKIGNSHFKSGELMGNVELNSNNISWNLSYKGKEDPLFFYPLKMYDHKLPRAKSLVGLPMATFNGSFVINDNEIKIKNWIGSQNHNWGEKHTDHYAWGQVAGFDNDPGSFLEIATARLKLGPVWTPFMTIMILRHRGKEYALNNLIQSFKATGAFDYFTWNFSSETNVVKIEGIISAQRSDFIGLTYFNPPGGSKQCLNSKIASCKLTIHNKKNGKIVNSETLETEHRAAFEILTDDSNHGVKIFI